MITLAAQRELYRLLREYGDACKDIAFHPAHNATHGWERAGHRYDAAQKALGDFIHSITEKARKEA